MSFRSDRGRLPFAQSLSGWSRHTHSDQPGRLVHLLGWMAQVQAPDRSRSRQSPFLEVL